MLIYVAGDKLLDIDENQDGMMIDFKNKFEADVKIVRYNAHLSTIMIYIFTSCLFYFHFI